MTKRSNTYLCRVQFECPVCGTAASNSGDPMPEIEEVDGSLYDTEFSCDECGSFFPAEVKYKNESLTVRLKGYPATPVQPYLAFLADPNEDDIWFDEPPVENPYTRFIEATDQIKHVMIMQGSQTDGSYLVNRMVFAQYISAFEAYLAETLVRNVEADLTAVKKILVVDKTLREKVFKLADFLNDPDLVLKEVRSYLRNIIYHRLPQVSALYENTLGVKILDNKTDADLLMRAVNYRHDCVHRNGFSKEGVRLDVFTPLYIEETAAIITVLVGRVEASIQFKGVTPVSSSSAF